MKHGLQYRALALGVALAVTLAPVSHGWGPVSQVSIVNTAVYVVSLDGSIPLRKFRQYVEQGARMEASEREAMYPNFDIDPVGTISTEISLLKSMMGDRIDPYFAYRLGALGTLVAEATAPLAEAPAPVQAQYYGDVDGYIGRAKIDPRNDRHQVDPSAYFSRLRTIAQAQDETIILEYRTGLGFEGLAKAAISQDASRSVDAVADVFYSIISSRVAFSNISSSNAREYALGAMEFYIQKKNLEEAGEVYKKMESLGLRSNDLRKRIGDMYYEGGYYDRAVQEYMAVLQSDPGRRDVIEHISDYYVKVGDEAMEYERLEAAEEAYGSALAANKLHPTAQSKLQGVEDLIEERDSRMGVARGAIQRAQDAESVAQQEALSGNYAQAIAALRLAEQEYRSVTPEFPDAARQASVGLQNVTNQLNQYKEALIVNAQVLSGAGYAESVKRIAASMPGFGEDGLHALVENEFQGAVDALRKAMIAEKDLGDG